MIRFNFKNCYCQTLMIQKKDVVVDSIEIDIQQLQRKSIQ